MVCRRTADGYAVKAGTAGTGRVLGIAKADTATCVASGDTNVNLLTGQFIRPCHASHTPGLGDIGKAVYASDDNTISNLPSDGPIAGILTGFEDGSGDAIFYIEPPMRRAGLGSKEIPIYPSMLAAGTPMAAFADNAASARASPSSTRRRWASAGTTTRRRSRCGPGSCSRATSTPRRTRRSSLRGEDRRDRRRRDEVHDHRVQQRDSARSTTPTPTSAARPRR
jgi:hypothetical protein